MSLYRRRTITLFIVIEQSKFDISRSVIMTSDAYCIGCVCFSFFENVAGKPVPIEPTDNGIGRVS